MSVATGLPSWDCEPTVSDLDRPADELLDCRGVEMDFWGDRDRGGGAVPRPLAGDEVVAATVVAAFCKLGGTLGTSNAELACRDAAVDW
jgi:hypothetical protein